MKMLLNTAAQKYLCAYTVIYAVTYAAVTSNQQQLVPLQGGKFQMGIDDNEGRNGESPSYESAVKPFQIDIFPVTNADFKIFLDAKPNFKTDAETRGWSVVFSGHLNSSQIKEQLHHNPDINAAWMVPIKEAKWSAPYGRGSSIVGINDHPVVHVSKRDAMSYCFWKGKRLLTEHEWEYAARGGLDGLEYPWGDSYEMGRTNLWQGNFPLNDSARDGYAGTSPVDAFKPQNNYGLYDMIGNVWEWTKTPYHERHEKQAEKDEHFIIKGGSYIDSRKGDVNTKARISSRDWKILHYSASNLGFRCGKNFEQAVSKKANILAVSRLTVHSEL